MSSFQLPPASVSFPQAELEVLQYWDQIDAFNKQLEMTQHKPKFHFFDGPPFATGLPHYGHLLAGTIKDVVCRYWAQNGFYVPRRFGWDTHGLPVEYEIDQKLGITSPQQIRDMGIHNYNEQCRSIVMRYASEWEKTVKRCGRWIDFKNDYKTLQPEFMESVWWVFSELWRKNLVYQGVKVMPYSTKCAASLSNFEAGQNYKDVQDPCCVINFPVVGEENTYFCAWTTTPWTLPSNLALCVNNELDYVKVQDPSGKLFWLAEARICELYPEKKGKKPEHVVLEKVKGSTLVGKKYVPLFDYFVDYEKQYPKTWTVLADNYVTSDSGTGIVHQAPFFGEDDYRICLANGVITKDSEIVCPIDENGCFFPIVTDFVGQYVKDADKNILKFLKNNGRLVQQSTITHSYPFCYRSDTPLIYRAIPSWFVRVEEVKDKLIANNQKAEWVPDFVQQKRFHNWLSGARDWAISRNRFWGCPIPVWQSQDKTQVICISSRKDLAEKAGLNFEDIKDIHREYVDDIEIPDPRGPEYPKMKRIDPVFDCWFESGAMPYGQSHYPFDDVKFREQGDGLADFIAEGLDQTRGWFYTLLILSTCLFDQPPAKHCIVNGLILAENGQKMSKRLRNYPPVENIIDQYGADAMRMYLCQSPAVRAQEVRFSPDGVKEVIKTVFLPWFNSHRFFAQNVVRYELTQKFQVFTEAELEQKVEHVMDKWILQNFKKLVDFVRTEMAGYRLYTVLPALVKFIEDLTNWYIRFNRLRMKEADSLVCLNVLFYVMLNMAKLMAPFTPFLAEYMHLQLKPLIENAPESIHFYQIPEYTADQFGFGDQLLTQKIEWLKSTIVLGRMCRRDKCKINSLKTPLSKITVVHESPLVVDSLKQFADYIVQEMNVLEIDFHAGEKGFATVELDPDFKKIRDLFVNPELGKVVKAVQGFCKKATPEMIAQFRITKTIDFEGVTITDEFCAVRLKPTVDEGTSTDENGFLVQFDLSQNDQLKIKAVERELFSTIQQLRKTNKLEFVDIRNVIITVWSGAEILADVIKTVGQKINGELKIVKSEAEVPEEDKIEIDDLVFTVALE
ncbi:Isoleucyl-tRNA_synthetase [Hexamita inflata]|uniref:isoleucine--tRNA ligase n=1 Tax=Hexamita inflata TaxID=28002 RepID=A0AA86NHR0_9EUKA|nr:Isoleucyl-tRNA synthetase [Hexamita inflata]